MLAMTVSALALAGLASSFGGALAACLASCPSRQPSAPARRRLRLDALAAADRGELGLQRLVLRRSADCSCRAWRGRRCCPRACPARRLRPAPSGRSRRRRSPARRRRGRCWRGGRRRGRSCVSVSSSAASFCGSVESRRRIVGRVEAVGRDALEECRSPARREAPPCRRRSRSARTGGRGRTPARRRDPARAARIAKACSRPGRGAQPTRRRRRLSVRLVAGGAAGSAGLSTLRRGLACSIGLA